MPRIFLCYTKEDESQVEEVYCRLQGLGFQPWMAKIDLTAGQFWKDEIRRAVKAADFFVIFLSHRSVAKQGYLQPEFKLALDVWEEMPWSIPILPFRFDKFIIPMPLRRGIYNWGGTYKFEELEEWIRSCLEPRWGTPRGSHLPPPAEKPPQKPHWFKRLIDRLRRKAEAKVPAKLGLHEGGVFLSVTSPSSVFPGLPFIIDVWAHRWFHREEVLAQAREAIDNAEIRIKSKGPVHISPGIILSVQLVLDGLVVEDAEDTLLWEGNISNATFSVRVPSDAKPGARRGQVLISLEGFQIARVDFVVRVGSAAQQIEEIKVNHIPAKQYRKAFASYASADRDAVLARLQGILKVIPSLDIFIDVLSLRSGQTWEQELWKIIPLNDVFYLFWSRNAKNSVWVEKEWRCALDSRGLDFIDPVPLVSPDEVPPPPELVGLHFNDWVLAFMRSSPRKMR